MISVKQAVPTSQLQQRVDDKTITHQMPEFLNDKKVVLFAVPGAFTPTCSKAHLPGYVALADQLKDKGVDCILCVSINDAFVMQAWGENQNAQHIMMMADGDGSFTKALGLGKETGAFGGYRSQRYAMIIENAIVTYLAVENAGEFNVSDAQSLLQRL